LRHVAASRTGWPFLSTSESGKVYLPIFGSS
jgi:hypothetical protein